MAVRSTNVHRFPPHTLTKTSKSSPISSIQLEKLRIFHSTLTFSNSNSKCGEKIRSHLTSFSHHCSRRKLRFFEIVSSNKDWIFTWVLTLVSLQISSSIITREEPGEKEKEKEVFSTLRLFFSHFTLSGGEAPFCSHSLLFLLFISSFRRCVDWFASNHGWVKAVKRLGAGGRFYNRKVVVIVMLYTDYCRVFVNCKRHWLF